MLFGFERLGYDLATYVGIKAGQKVRKECGKLKAKVEDKINGPLEEVQVEIEEVEIDF